MYGLRATQPLLGAGEGNRGRRALGARAAPMRSVPVMRGVHVTVVQQRGRLCVGIAAGVETLQRGVHVIHQRLQIHIIYIERQSDRERDRQTEVKTGGRW